MFSRLRRRLMKDCPYSSVAPIRSNLVLLQSLRRPGGETRDTGHALLSEDDCFETACELLEEAAPKMKVAFLWNPHHPDEKPAAQVAAQALGFGTSTRGSCGTDDFEWHFTWPAAPAFSLMLSSCQTVLSINTRSIDDKIQFHWLGDGELGGKRRWAFLDMDGCHCHGRAP